MIAVDKNGSFYSTADSVGFTDNKPDRAAVDRLVTDLRKAEEVRLKKRKERRGDEEADVTYINEKNKQFNQKLSRFYNKVRFLLSCDVYGLGALTSFFSTPPKFGTVSSAVL